MRKKGFRKDFTPEQYLAYLNSQADTSKFEHDGVYPENVEQREPWDKTYKSKKKVG